MGVTYVNKSTLNYMEDNYAITNRFKDLEDIVQIMQNDIYKPQLHKYKGGWKNRLPMRKR